MPDSTTESPTPLALLIADHIYQDRATGNWIVAGTFNTILTRRLPFPRSLEIFFQVTGISRPVELRLRVERASDGAPMIDIGGPITATDPLQVHTQKVRLLGLPFTEEGKYWVQLVSQQEILIQAPLYVRLTRSADPQERQRGTNEPDASEK